MLHLSFSLFIRSVSACGHRLQTGHRSSGGRHCQSDHSSDPQPRCQQQISRHLQHPVHTGHLSLTSNQPSSNTTQLILCLDSADSDYSCLFFPPQAILENNLPSEIVSKINLVDLAGRYDWKLLSFFFLLSFLAYFPPNSLTKLPSSGCLLQSCDFCCCTLPHFSLDIFSVADKSLTLLCLTVSERIQITAGTDWQKAPTSTSHWLLWASSYLHLVNEVNQTCSGCTLPLP